MRDVATLNQLLVLANLESYNAILINQGKSQKKRMELLRQLTVQQLQTLETVSLNNLTERLGYNRVSCGKKVIPLRQSAS